ncbi:hypothetical protein HCZ30_07475 [Marivivens donghaensis]|uniref:Uncharacterized protein n=1 Tax=Marivivens donghaensis TaxID=1699413 RepID=A0ABX0VWV1_9RHOB|nr:hypothetical protein [Marivivens donghaensis]NIY72274.1 hypothetical protein [Marivivens donghaensis]
MTVPTRHGHQRLIIASLADDNNGYNAMQVCVSTKTAWSGFLHAAFDCNGGNWPFKRFNRTFSNVAHRLCSLELKTSLLTNHLDDHELALTYRAIAKLEFSMLAIGVFEGIGIMKHAQILHEGNRGQYFNFDKAGKGVWKKGIKKIDPSLTKPEAGGDRIDNELGQIRDRIHVDNSFAAPTDYSEINDDRFRLMQILVADLLTAMAANSDATIPTSTNLTACKNLPE